MSSDHPISFFGYLLQMIYLFIVFLLSIYFYTSRTALKYNSNSHIPTNWPLLGMIPGLLRNAHRVHDFATDMLKESGGTFVFRGPWFAKMDMLVTSDPANVHHILSINFPNYPKGPEFRKIFDVFGDGIFNVDSEMWKVQRRATMSLFRHAAFCSVLETIVWRTVEEGLLPVLEFVSERGIEVDFQDLFQRFAFDIICELILDHNPKSLSIGLANNPCQDAFKRVSEAMMNRNMLPEKCWKLQKWLQIGKEKKLTQACETFDQFIYKCLSLKQDKNLPPKAGLLVVDDHNEQELDPSKAFMRAYYKDIMGKSASKGDPKKFLRDTYFSLMFAGRDTTSTALTWFFFLLKQNPVVESKILVEVQTILQTRNGRGEWKNYNFRMSELQKMVYLHGALCEALRLFPPIALGAKTSSECDVLPTGHRVDRDTKIILSLYSMGRTESIWGGDCMEFKPERWISERGGIKHEPSYKFTAFQAGPRTCLGKEMAFFQMKIVATTIIYNYHVEVVEGHPISPSDSTILQMKYGLKVKLTKRSDQ